MPHVEARGIRFYYQRQGTGPDVILLHGVTGNLAVWMLSGLMQRLAANFRVTAFDLRGHGYSDTPHTGYTSAEMAHDVAEVCDALDVREAKLLGHSFGGVVALHTAVSHPERVSGIVLSDPFVPALRHLQPDPRGWLGFDAYKANAATAGIEIEGDLWDLQSLLRQAADLPEDRRRKFVERVGQPALDRLVRLAGTTCGRDVARTSGLTVERIARVAAPVVCLYGEHSPFMPMCDELVRLLPDASVDIIPDAQHFGFEENPGEFVDRVERNLCRMAGLEPSVDAPRPDYGERRNIMTDSRRV